MVIGMLRVCRLLNVCVWDMLVGIEGVPLVETEGLLLP
jgi:hypothetical protein